MTGSGQREPRGYFGIGVERLSKPMNLGTLFRSAHAFGASFVFTVDATYSKLTLASDTSHAVNEVPYYRFETASDLVLPKECKLVAVELVDDAIDLPSFRHPRSAAYILGPEKDSVSDELLARADHIIKIPTRFCINVGVAGAIVMYDRLLTTGRFSERPITPDGPVVPLPEHVHGGMFNRKPDNQA